MYWLYYLVISLLLSVGIMLILDVRRDDFSVFFRDAQSLTIKLHRRRKENQHISLKKKVELFSGTKKSNFIVRSFSEAAEILAENHESQRIKGVYILSFLCGLMGLVVAMGINNVFLIPPFVLGAALGPVWVVKLTSSNKKKKLNDILEVALSGVTSSYMRNDNIIVAVEENLGFMNGIVKQAFAKFVNENKLVNANISLGIQKLQRAIDNNTFHEWCDALYQCQTDRSLKVTLFPIVNRFSETKAIQAELDTLMMMPFKETITVAIVVILSIPLMAVMNPEWYTTLTTTVVGKIILSIVAFSIIFSINKSVALSVPLKHGEK